jgi:flagellar biosynthesis/type III secretory pathway chaperone
MDAMTILTSLLDAQREALLRLQQLCRDERAALMSSDVEQLAAITEAQQEMMARQSRLSGRITQLLATLATQLGLAAPSLREVAAALGGEAATTLSTYHRELTALSDDVQRESRVNWYLVQHALKYMEFTLSLVGKSQEGPTPYLPPTRSAPRAMHVLMDHHA